MVRTPSLPVKERERESKKEGERERENMVFEFISLLLTMATFFLKGMTGALAPFSCLVLNN
jgi:hypothetical protein